MLTGRGAPAHADKQPFPVALSHLSPEGCTLTPIAAGASGLDDWRMVQPRTAVSIDTSSRELEFVDGARPAPATTTAPSRSSRWRRASESWTLRRYRALLKELGHGENGSVA
jgi:hypothetical protein